MGSCACINRWVLVGLNLVSWIFSVVTLASCTFLKFSVGDGPNNSSPGYDVGNSYPRYDVGNSYPGYDGYDPYPYPYDDYSSSYEYLSVSDMAKKFQYGLFSYNRGDGTCVSSSGKASSYIQTGRAFGILQNLSLASSMIGILLVILCIPGKAAKWVWLATKIMYCAALLWTLLIFITFGDCADASKLGFNCKPGAAAIINIINVLFVLAMATLCWFVPVPSAPLCRCCGRQNTHSPHKTQPIIEKSSVSSTNHSAYTYGGTAVTRTVKETAQGRIIIEEVTHPDGSKTITESLEQV